jgi:hypothetical protein
MKHQRGWLAIAVAVSFAACTRAPRSSQKLGAGPAPEHVLGAIDGAAQADVADQVDERK